jgi:transcriptional regulator with XRE-family HTH domain
VPLTNRQLAAKIGLTHSTVSRIRNGERLPSITAMEAIARECGWKVTDQLKSRTEGTYAADFRSRALGFVPDPVPAATAPVPG